MSSNYVVSAHKPSIVTHAVVGSFIEKNQLYAVFAKVNRLEVFKVSPKGLVPCEEIPIFGRIAALKKYRIPNDDRESLLVVTMKFNMCVLRWDSNGKLVTKLSGVISDRVGRQSDTGMIAMVHKSGLMGFRLYDGVIKFIEWTGEPEFEEKNLRCDDVHIIDVDFLNTDLPMIAYIYQDFNGRHFKITMVDLKEIEVGDPLHKIDNIEANATFLIPFPNPCAGCFIVGKDSLSYYKGYPTFFLYRSQPYFHPTKGIADSLKRVKKASKLPSKICITCYCPIDSDGSRFLLGDLDGNIYILLSDICISDDPPLVTDHRIECIGQVSIPQCLLYLDNAFVYVGSKYGDNELIRLEVDLKQDGSYITHVEKYASLAPIRDMVVMDTKGQQQVVTCSGAFKDGSLRVVRNGIGIDILHHIECQNVRYLGTFQMQSDYDEYLVVSKDSRTYFITMNSSLSRVHMKGLIENERTYYVGNMREGGVVQITTEGIYYVNGEINDFWKAPSRICVQAVNELAGQIVVTCKKDLHYLIVSDRIVHKLVHTFDDEISCVDITPIGDRKECNVIALSFWIDFTAALFTLPDMEEVVRIRLGNCDMLARSIMLCTLEGIVYLLVAMGDGTLYYYHVDMKTGSLINEKKATVGMLPLSLKKFYTRETLNIFVSSNQPAVIYSSNRKLVFSNVNTGYVFHMTPLNSERFRNCIVFDDEKLIYFGRIDSIQKLHIKTIPIGDCPARIAHQTETGTLAVITQKLENIQRPAMDNLSKMGDMIDNIDGKNTQFEKVELSKLVLLDSTTMQVLDTYVFLKNELALSIASCKLGDDPTPYYAVGTAALSSNETHTKAGRLLIFNVNAATKKWKLIHDKEMKGSSYSIKPLMGKLVVAVNSSVRLFRWMPDRELRLECSDFDNVAALYLETVNDRILVGDLMRSLSLLKYVPAECSFQKIARDYITNWMSACTVINRDMFLGAENGFNLFTATIDSSSLTTEDRTRLQEVGFYYLGEYVNVFRHGSLVGSQGDSMMPYSTPILYGSSEGGLGLIVQINEKYHKFLNDLQSRIANFTQSCLRVSHSAYRRYESEKRFEDFTGFIDGDLIETLLDMDTKHVKNLIDGLIFPVSQENEEPRDATVEEVLKFVEDLTRIH